MSQKQEFQLITPFLPNFSPNLTWLNSSEIWIESYLWGIKNIKQWGDIFPWLWKWTLVCHLLSAVLIFVSWDFVLCPKPHFSIFCIKLSLQNPTGCQLWRWETGGSGQSGQGGSVSVWKHRYCSSLCSFAAQFWACAKLYINSSFQFLSLTI